MPIDVAAALAGALAAVREAGERIRADFGAPRDVRRKGRIDLVTATDLAVEAMLKEFWKQSEAVWPGETKPKGKDLLAAITLASIVEKETGVDAERPRVAGVFANRLAKGMLLQTDPTIIYGLGEKFDGNLTRANLEDTANPYNTYVRPGLPPGPICSPGLKSLQAVAAPEVHDLYYFVATGEGEHKFSKTLDEHINAVNKYQRKRGKK